MCDELKLSYISLVLIIKSFTMGVNEFIANYESNLEEIRAIIKPDLRTVIDQLKKIKPYDLVTSETYLMTENQARIFVWRLFLQKAMNDFPNSFPKPSSDAIPI